MLKKLAGMPDGIVALEAAGTVTAGDYQRVFAPLIEDSQRTGHRMRLLYQFGPEFQRITPAALWSDTRLGTSYVRTLDGCAVVSDVEWIRIPTRRIATWMPCPIWVFHNAERDDAIAWLASLNASDDVSTRDMITSYLGGVSAVATGAGEFVISRGATCWKRTRKGPS